MRSVQMRFLTLKDNLVILYAKMELSGVFLIRKGLATARTSILFDDAIYTFIGHF